MAKRFQPMKEFGRTTKKPKLDISINKKTNNARDNVHGVSQQPAQSNASLWDDDEDDVILLASQVVESEIAAKSNWSKNNQTITESEITFSEFQPRIQQHSTQRPVEPPKLDLLSQMFDDDDDFVRLAAVVEKDCRKHMPSSAQLFDTLTGTESMVFKKPELPSGSKAKSSNMQTKQINIINENALGSQSDSSAAARRQVAMDRQVQFLMERLDAVKQENAKLNQDLGKVKDNMQAKTGEASMLRDELRRAKQQVENLKMEKLLQTEAANVESKLKIEQLANEVKTKESQLQLKNMEFSVLKMRQADESRRLEMSMRDNAADDKPSTSEKLEQIKIATKPKTLAERLSLMRLRNFNIALLPKTIETTSVLLTKNAFQRADEHGISKKFNTLFQQELENVQLILAQLQLQPDTFDAEKLRESVRKVFSEFWSYVHTLEYRVYEKVQPYHDYDVMADESKRPPGCLLLKTALYEKERAINLRRYIAALSVICQKSATATRLILQAKHEDYPLIQIAIDAIIKLGFSTEINEHFGIIEACAVLMRSILMHLNADLAEDNEFFDLIFNFLKYLVFTRPNPWALYELSFSILDCAHRSLPLLSKLCENSHRRNFEVDRSKCIYRFTNDACFLQVYCGLMESTFPLYRQLSETHFELQTQLCLNHVRFVFNCLTQPPHFVQKMLTLSDDDEESPKNKHQDFSNLPKYTISANNTNADDKAQSTSNMEDEAPSTIKQAAVKVATREAPSLHNSSLGNTPNSANSSSTTTCDCFTQMCLSVVSMIWLTLRQWLRMEKCILTPRIGLISRIAVRLLYAMFCDHYHACLFREEEDTTKHYFYLICTWWQENATELQFTYMQLKLLQKLSESHAMPKLLKDEEVKRENILSDLVQWSQMTNDHDTEFTLKDGDSIIKNLGLLDDIFDPVKFLASRNKDHLRIKIFGDN